MPLLTALSNSLPVNNIKNEHVIITALYSTYLINCNMNCNMNGKAYKTRTQSNATYSIKTIKIILTSLRQNKQLMSTIS